MLPECVLARCGLRRPRVVILASSRQSRSSFPQARRYTAHLLLSGNGLVVGFARYTMDDVISTQYRRHLLMEVAAEGLIVLEGGYGRSDL